MKEHLLCMKGIANIMTKNDMQYKPFHDPGALRPRMRREEEARQQKLLCVVFLLLLLLMESGDSVWMLLWPTTPKESVVAS